MMNLGLMFLFWVKLVFSHFGSASSFQLLKLDLSQIIIATDNNDINQRYRRQAIIDPQMFLLREFVLDVPLPTNNGFYEGNSTFIDECKRDEIEMEDGSCQSLLTIGSCNYTELVFVDPETEKGYCGQRLCPPGRIFIHGTQLCHDPRQSGVCPPGRELYYSAYGTSVCTCPDGTVENGDDMNEDVCVIVSGKSDDCVSSEVFGYKDLKSPPQCLDDPCLAENMMISSSELPFLPSRTTGICYQIGQSKAACPNDRYFAFTLDAQAGECVTLEEAGYNVYDNNTLEELQVVYGSEFLSRNRSSIITDNYSQEMYQRTDQNIGPMSYGYQYESINQQCYGNLVSVIQQKLNSVLEQFMTELENNIDCNDINIMSNVRTNILSRKKRTLFAYASPSNVYETRLLGCRAGAARDINGKCKTIVLPSEIPKEEGTKAAPPIQPTPMCPADMAYNIKRECVATTTAETDLTAANLG